MAGLLGVKTPLNAACCNRGLGANVSVSTRWIWLAYNGRHENKKCGAREFHELNFLL